MRFGACREPLLAQLGGFPGDEAAQHPGKMAQGDGYTVSFCSQATCGGGHAHHCRTYCTAAVVRVHSRQRQKWGHTDETGPRGSSSRAFARTASQKQAKVCVITPALESDSRMPFRKHQVDCLHPWKLSSHGKLLRRLLAIFNLRGHEEGPGPVAGPSAEGFRVRAGRGDGWGLHAGVFCQVELSKKVDHFLVYINIRGCPRRAERARHGHPDNARQYAALGSIHPSRRMRNRPVSANKKG